MLTCLRRHAQRAGSVLFLVMVLPPTVPAGVVTGAWPAVTADVLSASILGAVFVGAVGGLAVMLRCAIVHALAHRGVAQVGQVVGLGAFPASVLFFTSTKLPMLHFFAQLRAGAQAGKGNQRAGATVAPGFRRQYA